MLAARGDSWESHRTFVGTRITKTHFVMGIGFVDLMSYDWRKIW